MWVTETIRDVIAPEEDRRVGDIMLNLWNEIDELYREARINRKLLKVKTKKFKTLRKEYPRVYLYEDEIQYDNFEG